MIIIRVIVKDIPDNCTECIFYIDGKCLLTNTPIDCIHFLTPERQKECLLIEDRRKERKKHED